MHINLDKYPDYYKKYKTKKIYCIGILIVMLVLLFILSISLGAFSISFADAVKTLILNTQSKKLDLVIWNIRLPQVLTAITAGIALTLAGLIMQTILNNPLASPFTLGISNAAAFGAAVSVMFFAGGSVLGQGIIQINNAYITSLSAFIFCLLTSLFILLTAKIKRSSPEVMALTGIAIGSLFMAGTMFLQYFATDFQLASMVFWTFGDVSRASWHELGIISVITFLAYIYFSFNIWNYNAMQSGEETAKGIGVNTEFLRIISMLVATVLTSVVVAFLGIIGFVGLVCPHIARRIVGDDHRFLVPASSILGAILLLAADTAARTVFLPHVLPVAILTSFMGAPVFIYLILKGYRR
jgi:iron complex transport system permease protein